MSATVLQLDPGSFAARADMDVRHARASGAFDPRRMDAAQAPFQGSPEVRFSRHFEPHFEPHGSDKPSNVVRLAGIDSSMKPGVI